jgi:hypothetical protein
MMAANNYKEHQTNQIESLVKTTAVIGAMFGQLVSLPRLSC